VVIEQTPWGWEVPLDCHATVDFLGEGDESLVNEEVKTAGTSVNELVDNVSMDNLEDERHDFNYNAINAVAGSEKSFEPVEGVLVLCHLSP
jgi:hypothetical protein